MKRTKKKRNQISGSDFPLFEKSSGLKNETPCKAPNSSNVIYFHSAIEIKKNNARTSLEKDALKAILARARKVNW